MSTPERKFLERLPLNKPTPRPQKQTDSRFAPRFTKQLEPIKAIESTVITLEVEFEANPAPEVVWYKDGFLLQSSEDFHIDSTGKKSVLRIREAFKSDTGMYQVKLFNEVGLAQTKAYLTVTPIGQSDLTPTILINLKNVTVNSGDPVKFQTQAIGNPTPVITWFKDDEKLEMSQRIKEFKENDIYTLLIIEAVAADNGCYECVAENAHGKVYTRAYLTVFGDKQVEPPAPVPLQVNEQGVRMVPVSSKFTQPVIDVALKDQTVKEGSSVLFETIVKYSDREFYTCLKA